MSSFPDVLSATLSYRINVSNTITNFTVPSTYAFAVVQVVITYVGTSPSNITRSEVVNLIIKGGEFYELGDGTARSDGPYNRITAKVTALCHKKPT